VGDCRAAVPTVVINQSVTDHSLTCRCHSQGLSPQYVYRFFQTQKHAGKSASSVCARQLQVTHLLPAAAAAGWLLLGAVMLSITGVEAMFAGALPTCLLLMLPCSLQPPVVVQTLGISQQRRLAGPGLCMPTLYWWADGSGVGHGCSCLLSGLPPFLSRGLH
jgi:hypothetical protein